MPVIASASDPPAMIEGATTINPAQALALFDEGVVFVDVRKGSDFEAGRIPGAIHLDVKSALNVDSLGEVVAKDAPVVLYCNGHACLRSSQASTMAVEWGYSSVYYFRDGYPAWEAADYPIE